MTCILTNTQRDAMWRAQSLQIVTEGVCPDCEGQGIVWGIQTDAEPRLFYVCLNGIRRDLVLSWYSDALSARSESLVPHG